MTCGLKSEHFAIYILPVRLFASCTRCLIILVAEEEYAPAWKILQERSKRVANEQGKFIGVAEVTKTTVHNDVVSSCDQWMQMLDYGTPLA